VTTTFLRAFGAAAALALSAAHAAHAQGDAVGRIEGVVFDSVHARPLAGAHVVAVGTGAQAELHGETTSDSAGRWHIDSLPAGRYVVGFESALLDSLEVAASPRTATLAPGQVASLALALPSAATLRAAVCLGAALPEKTGVIYGHVVSAETESPLAGVSLAMAWRELDVDRTTLRPINRERTVSVVTDEHGWYRMCGVPTGTWVSMQAQLGERSGPVLRTRVDDSLGVVIQHLSLATGSARAGDTTSTLADAGASGTATLTGVVRGPAGDPIPLAEVRVRGTRAESRTDDSGSFTLGKLPAGTQQLEVRRVGYVVAEVPVELRSDATVRANVRLERIVVNLDSVLVVASRPKYPDFYAHKNSAFGVFLGPEEIAKQHVSRTAEIVAKIPGFRIEQRGYHTDVVSTRQEGLGPCRASIIIDGIVVQADRPPSADDVHPSEIGAIEVYRSGEEMMAPAEYHIGKCGGVVIWTKR
jgi:hypothetical protein